MGTAAGEETRDVARRGLASPLCVAVGGLLLTIGWPHSGLTQDTPESRAISYLVREVPDWSKENDCFSCHNNGDGARALYAASALGYPLGTMPPLKDTSNWLVMPTGWKDNGGDEQASDKQLAAIQFSHALLAATESGVVTEGAALREAGALLVQYQQPDGSWQIDRADSVGSPTTYGRLLATVVARRVLQSNAEIYRAAIERATSWLARQRPQSVCDCAALLMGWDDQDPQADAIRRHCLDMLRRGQAENGGWGPYRISQPEPYDSALALIALTGLPDRPDDVREMIRRGRQFLVDTQFDDGGWPETTRPAHRESYAQHISTTGWATLALLATRKQ